MPIQFGTVDELKLSREIGTVKLKPSGDTFALYWDLEVDIIDPTEMVRRNWMIGLLQQAAVRKAEIRLEHVGDTNNTVISVRLHALPKTSPPATMVTTGTVKLLEVTRERGFVTIFGVTSPVLGPESRDRAEDHQLMIYTPEGSRLVHAEESHRRTRVVALLRQALAGGLRVSVRHANEENAVIYRASLHAPE